MALIPSSQGWQFKTESALEEVVWHNLSKLLKLEPLKRQFSVSGNVCDMVAAESSRLVVIELKNAEDRYVVQQLVRYYDAISTAVDIPFDIDVGAPPRLVAIAPSFHADTLIDCKYSTLSIELITFRIEPITGEQLGLVLSNAASEDISFLPLPKALQTAQANIQMPEPPRKLLNWLNPVHEIEHTWILTLRKQLLGADSRMRERVEPNSIFYEKNKSRPCCELRKIKPSEYRGEGIDCYLWLPDPENNPRVLRMAVGFDLDKQQVTFMGYSRNSSLLKPLWRFPECARRY